MTTMENKVAANKVYEPEFEKDGPTSASISNKQSVGEKCQDILDLRRTEFRRLDREGQVYLDYTGGGLYPESLIRAHTELLLNNTLGNPHSNNPTSLAATHLCEKARRDVLRFYNADPNEYDCIFTPNASGALRIVGESFPFTKGGQYVLLVDNHNSVNGIREFTVNKGAAVHYLNTNAQLRMDEDATMQALEHIEGDGTKPKLFAYPAQSNFSGVKHSLEWVSAAQELGWYVILDASAYVSTSPLDLSVIKPDFVTMSFYKMFGYPTGVGALLVKKACMPILCKPWFAGGTIEFVTTAAAGRDTYILAHNHEAFEDGTINYLSLPAVSLGLDWLSKIGMKRINNHIRALTHDLITGLLKCKHSNGKNLIRILGPNTSFSRGGTVAVIYIDKNGKTISPMLIEKLANMAMISVRSGCFCNPGDSEMVFVHEWEEVRKVLHETHDGARARQLGLSTAAANRISLGVPTSEGDLKALFAFNERFKDKTVEECAEAEAKMKNNRDAKKTCLQA